MVNNSDQPHSPESCKQISLPVTDAIEILNGKWKLPVMIALSFGPKRFRELSREIHGITDKVLAHELKEMEINQLITRTSRDTFPPTVEYEISEHGKSLQPVLEVLKIWGEKHRKKIMG